MELLDIVVLTEDLETPKLKKGALGTIVEEIDLDIFLVEFADTKGIPYAMPILKAEQLMKVYYEPVAA